MPSSGSFQLVFSWGFLNVCKDRRRCRNHNSCAQCVIAPFSFPFPPAHSFSIWSPMMGSNLFPWSPVPPAPRIPVRLRFPRAHLPSFFGDRERVGPTICGGEPVVPHHVLFSLQWRPFEAPTFSLSFTLSASFVVARVFIKHE